MLKNRNCFYILIVDCFNKLHSITTFIKIMPNEWTFLSREFIIIIIIMDNWTSNMHICNKYYYLEIIILIIYNSCTLVEIVSIGNGQENK